MAHIYAAVT